VCIFQKQTGGRTFARKITIFDRSKTTKKEKKKERERGKEREEGREFIEIITRKIVAIIKRAIKIRRKCGQCDKNRPRDDFAVLRESDIAIDRSDILIRQ